MRLLSFAIVLLGFSVSAFAAVQKTTCRMSQGGHYIKSIYVNSYRTGGLLSGAGVVTIGEDGAEQKSASFSSDLVAGFYNAHQKLLVYVNDLVDENQAMCAEQSSA
jgi:hypothetical protein